MRSKTKETAISGSKKKKPAKSALNAMEKQLTLLGYVRGQDWSQELIESLHTVDQELASSYPLAQKTQAGSTEEEVVLSHIRTLEDTRFELLSQLHGNRVNHYGLFGASNPIETRKKRPGSPTKKARSRA